jgi:hypothetical protein
LLLLLPACRESTLDPEEGRLRGPCPAERAAGLFEVELGERFSSVSGRVLASPAPRTPPHEYFDVSLPHPGYDAGAAIELRTGGGEVPPFRLQAVGLAPLKLLTRDLTLEHGIW